MAVHKRHLAVVQLSDYRNLVGGIASFLDAIIPHLAERYELKLIGVSNCEPIGKWTRIRLRDRDYAFLPMMRFRKRTCIPDRFRLAVAMLRCRKAILNEQIDAFYIHSTEPAAVAMWFSKAPIVVHVHGLYNLFRFSRFWAGRLYAMLYEPLYPAVFSRCAKVLGVGTEEEFESFSRVMRVRSGRAIPTCIRDQCFYLGDRLAARQKLGIDPDAVVVLYAGRFEVAKNPALLLEAARSLRHEIPKLKIVFAGTGSLRPQLESMIDAGDNVEFAGLLPPEQLAATMNAANVLALPSKVEAFTSIALLEALSCGLPVVATPLAAASRILRPDRNGSVADDFTPEAFASALRQALLSPPPRQWCAESVRAYTAAAVSAEVAEQIDQVFASESSSVRNREHGTSNGAAKYSAV